MRFVLIVTVLAPTTLALTAVPSRADDLFGMSDRACAQASAVLERRSAGCPDRAGSSLAGAVGESRRVDLIYDDSDDRPERSRR